MSAHSPARYPGALIGLFVDRNAYRPDLVLPVEKPEFVEMIIEPAHGVLDGHVKIPEGVRERNLNAAPHKRIGSAQDDQKLMNELRPTSLRSPRRWSTAHPADCSWRARAISAGPEKIVNGSRQLRKIPLYDGPHDFEIDTEIVVDHFVAHPGDLLPRHVRLARLGVLRQILTA